MLDTVKGIYIHIVRLQVEIQASVFMDHIDRVAERRHNPADTVKIHLPPVGIRQCAAGILVGYSIPRAVRLTENTRQRHRVIGIDRTELFSEGKTFKEAFPQFADLFAVLLRNDQLPVPADHRIEPLRIKFLDDARPAREAPRRLSAPVYKAGAAASDQRIDDPILRAALAQCEPQHSTGVKGCTFHLAHLRRLPAADCIRCSAIDCQ